MHELVSENRLVHTYKLKLEGGYVKVVFDELALDWEATLDGKLVVETSLEDLTPEQVIEQYRGLREIEDSFRVPKSTLELRPMNHWTPPRIEAHVFICVLALVIERVMKARLRRAISLIASVRDATSCSRVCGLRMLAHDCTRRSRPFLSSTTRSTSRPPSVRK